jgi:pimeloyl-ACP methyl ester carboxylesterase
MKHAFDRIWFLPLMGLLAVGPCFATFVCAQPKAAPAKNAPAKGAAKSDEPEIPEPEEITLETKDGVSLKCQYYPGILKDKAIPVVMLHGWDGNRNDVHSMAMQVQARGHAVIAPDMRGHGGSKKMKQPDGRQRNLDPGTMAAKDVALMEEDLEAIKRFLLSRNNEKKLNVEMLTIMASDVTCITAMNWSMKDWGASRVPGFKQGQDVKGLILLSPVQTFKGATVQASLKALASIPEVAFLVVAGKQDSKSMSDFRRIESTLTGMRSKATGDAEKGLYFYELETSLKGTKLLKERELRVTEMVLKFLDVRFSDSESYAWRDRKRPLDE